MPNIKLRDGSGVETTYNNVDTITVPLADGTGTWTYGLTDEELTFQGSGKTDFSSAFFPGFDKYKSRIKFIPYTENNVTGIFVSPFNNIRGDASMIKYDASGLNEVNIYIGYNANDYITTLPTVITDNGATVYFKMGFSNGMASFTDYSHLITLLNNSYTGNRTSPTNNSSLQWDIYGKGSVLLDSTDVATAYQNQYNRSVAANKSTVMDVSGSFGIESGPRNKIVIPVLTQAVTSSLSLYENGYDFSGINTFTFLKNNGQPYTAKIYNGTLNLENVGWATSWSTYRNFQTLGGTNILKPGSSFSAGDIVTVTAEQHAYYNLHKDDTLIYSHGGENSNTTRNVYAEGETVNQVRMAMAYSCYNYDSAVETINSLPDNTAYLTSTSRTAPTIKFRYWAGCNTDAGKIGNLTSEEIAVATAKGWTVAFNNNKT